MRSCWVETNSAVKGWDLKKEFHRDRSSKKKNSSQRELIVSTEIEDLLSPAKAHTVQMS
jgi:hypothetical protein